MKRRRPSSQKRRSSGIKPPLGVALSYAAAIRGWLEDLQAYILKTVLDGWESNRVAFPGTVPRTDASDFVGTKIGGINLYLEERLDPSKLTPEIAKFAKRVATKNGEEVRRLIGISAGDIGLKTTLDGFQDRNVGLIKTLAGKQIDDIRTLLEQGEIGAWRVEELSQKIKDSFGVNQSRADLLARDQTLKLNGDLTKVRQQNAGITKYIWTAVGDDRTRPMHAELDGTIQQWAVPPQISPDGRTGHPGEDYQCRCTAFPVLDELEEPG